jgi:PPOX class probable F420-dependent enzyme
MTIGDEKYASFTTYRRSGDAVASPVWLAPLDDGRLGFWTSSGSGKVKRLRHTSKVTLQPSDARGKVKPGSAVVTGTAVLVGSDTPEYAEVQRKIVAKYGFMTKFTKLLNTIGGIVKRKRIPYGDTAVIITLDA